MIAFYKETNIRNNFQTSQREPSIRCRLPVRLGKVADLLKAFVFFFYVTLGSGQWMVREDRQVHLANCSSHFKKVFLFVTLGTWTTNVAHFVRCFMLTVKCETRHNKTLLCLFCKPSVTQWLVGELIAIFVHCTFLHANLLGRQFRCKSTDSGKHYKSKSLFRRKE